MFTIFTESPSEKDILEQDYANFNDRFHIKLQEAPAITGILRTISYQLFQAAPPPLAQHITALAIDSLHLKLSLVLYRQLLVKIKKTQRLLHLYRDYFLSVASLMDSPYAFQSMPLVCEFTEETSAIKQLQLFEALPSEQLLFTDFQAQLQTAVGKHSSPSIQKTRKTAADDAIIQVLPLREKLNLTYKKQEKEQEQGGQWWRLKNGQLPDSPSRELSQFEPQGKEIHVFQDSISGLIADQIRFDKERQQELGRKSKRTQQSFCMLFNRRMRDKIIKAKLRRRKK